MNARRRWILAIAAASVLVAAMDTYVIVLALPAIMANVGIGVDQLQAATPIISGFLLGYVVVMPLLGRLSDLYGRRPLLILCLAVFAGGSLVTASATDLGSVVAGRGYSASGLAIGTGLARLTGRSAVRSSIRQLFVTVAAEPSATSRPPPMASPPATPLAPALPLAWLALIVQWFSDRALFAL